MKHKDVNDMQWEFISTVNRILTKQKARYEVSNHNNLCFGGDMLRGNNSDIVRTTIAHRFLGKFEEPDTKHDQQLRRECEDSYLEYECTVGKSYSFYSSKKEPGVTRTLYHARLLVREWLTGLDNGSQLRKVIKGRSVQLRYAKTDDIEITPGETFFSLRGETSMYQKLRTKESWTVTPEAADEFIKLVYANRGLKQAAKAHFRPLSQEDSRALFSSYNMYDRKNIGFAIFRSRMYTDVLTLVNGSRASSVYKNTKSRRFINIEPFGNVIIQRQIGLGLRPILSALGNDLEVGQQEHKALIENPYYSTIDLSKASDSTWNEFVRFMFEGTTLYKDLMDYRSPYVLLSDGTYHANYKLSSMGNGFTFEVMTLLLLAVGRVLDNRTRVYGDDIIIRNRHAEHMLNCLKAAGYQPNLEKTFVNARFRESCGSFFLDGVGYISCFEIKWCESMVNASALVTKLQTIERDHPVEFKQVFGTALKDILDACPALLKGPLTYDLSDQWIQDASSRRASMRDEAAKRLHQDVVKALATSISDFQLTGKDRLETVIVHTEEAHCATRIVYENRLPVPLDVFQRIHWVCSGRVAKDIKRYSTFSTASVHLVGVHGTNIRLCDIRDIHKFTSLFESSEKKEEHTNNI